MTLSELRAELSVKTIEFEIALDKGLPHLDLIKIYRGIKELHYQLLMESIKGQPERDSFIIE